MAGRRSGRRGRPASSRAPARGGALLVGDEHHAEQGSADVEGVVGEVEVVAVHDAADGVPWPSARARASNRSIIAGDQSVAVTSAPSRAPEGQPPGPAATSRNRSPGARPTRTSASLASSTSCGARTGRSLGDGATPRAALRARLLAGRLLGHRRLLVDSEPAGPSGDSTTTVGGTGARNFGRNTQPGAEWVVFVPSGARGRGGRVGDGAGAGRDAELGEDVAHVTGDRLLDDESSATARFDLPPRRRSTSSPGAERARAW